MDPITGAIVAAVFWFFAISIGSVVIFTVVGLLFALLGAWLNHDWPALVGVVLAWLGSVAWGLFAVVQVILQIVQLVTLLGA